MKTMLKQILFSATGFLFLSVAVAEPVPAVVDTPTSELAPAPAATEMPLANNTNEQAEDLAQTEMTGFSRGVVARSIFTTLIDNREPVDKVKQVPEQTNDVFYFTELRDMAGQTAKHRWEYKGKVVAEVKFNVRGPRWRVWSKKSFTPGWAGDWKVSVVNGADEVISEEIIAFSEASADIIESEDANKGNVNQESTILPNAADAPDNLIVN